MINNNLQLERRDRAASQTLRSALTKAESAHPGLSLELVQGILRRAEVNLNVNESILRLQGQISDTDGMKRKLEIEKFIIKILENY